MKLSFVPCLRSALLAVGLLSTAVSSSAAILPKITFGHVDGLVTSITFDPVSFELTADYSSSELQIRIFDLYAGSGTFDTGNLYTGFGLEKNDTGLFENRSINVTPWTAGLGGNLTDGDMIMWVGIPFSFVTGDTFTVSGTGNAGDSMDARILPPTNGTYLVHLISAQNGSSIATPVLMEVAVSVVPEPGTSAPLAATAVLGFAALRRRGRAE